jgi:hypothetical protein
MRQKTINLRNQGSFDKKFDFFSQILSHIPRWVRLVQKTRAKNSHAWALLTQSSVWPVVRWLVLHQQPVALYWASNIIDQLKDVLYSLQEIFLIQ